jgi:dipeptidase E
MRLFLTSSGLTNSSLTRSLCGLLTMPIHQAKVAFIPTAANVSSETGWLDKSIANLRNSGIASIEIVDLAILETEIMLEKCTHADVIWLSGGNTYFLLDWVRRSGLAAALPQLLKDRVYVGVSAGSMIAGPGIETNAPFFPKEEEHRIDDLRALELVPFAVIPHLSSASYHHITPESIESFSATVSYPIIALDDNSAIEVNNGKLRLVSEGLALTYNNSLNEIRFE